MIKKIDLPEIKPEEKPHYFAKKAVGIKHSTKNYRSPRGIEWCDAIWNADIFFGEVPILKLTIALSLFFAIII